MKLNDGFPNAILNIPQQSWLQVLCEINIITLDKCWLLGVRCLGAELKYKHDY